MGYEQRALAQAFCITLVINWILLAPFGIGTGVAHHISWSAPPVLGFVDFKSEGAGRDRVEPVYKITGHDSPEQHSTKHSGPQFHQSAGHGSNISGHGL